MAYNITLLDNVSSVGETLSFINVNAAGIFFVSLIVALIIIITMSAIRENVPQIRALFYSLLITFVPIILLRGIVNWGDGLLPDWYVILHIVLLAITGLFAYLQRN